MSSTSLEDCVLNGSGNGTSIEQVPLPLVYPALDRRRRRHPRRPTLPGGRHPSDVYGDTGGVVKAARQTAPLIDYRLNDLTSG